MKKETTKIVWQESIKLKKEIDSCFVTAIKNNDVSIWESERQRFMDYICKIEDMAESRRAFQIVDDLKSYNVHVACNISAIFYEK